MNTWENPAAAAAGGARMFGWWTTWAVQDQQHAFGFASSADGCVLALALGLVRDLITYVYYTQGVVECRASCSYRARNP